MASSTQTEDKVRQAKVNFAQCDNAEVAKALEAITAHLNDLKRARPTKEIGDGKPGRTQKTIKRILRAAYDVFTREGHAGLSLRKVADEAGIAVGNLTYHFPAKTVLIETMLREALSDYVEAHLEHLQPDRDTPLESLMKVVEFYVRNARTSHQFFYQLWGYAGSGEDAKANVRSLYRPIGRFVYYLVKAANPKLTDDEIRRAVLQIFSLEEGYKLFIGMGPEDASAIQTAEADIRILTKRIIDMG
ncbi:TetR/AcrR family transcriptional regulator [Hyphococcus sp.]|uniref:TetR/AcrR family transcriptional regulator n=1 Tax=Hyphococcus sp. TaxID=2038636 RepID=UPI003CCBE68E